MKDLKENVSRYLLNLCKRYPCLKIVENEIVAAYLMLEEAYKKEGKLLIAGNGGSASDAEHIVGELMKCQKQLQLLKR